MAKWLFKTEPSEYSFAQLVKDGKTVWTGVKNALAQKHLRAIRKGDQILIYHTGAEKAVVGMASATSDAYPDQAASELCVVDIAPVKPLAHAVTLAVLKADPGLADFALVRLPRLSVMPVADAQWSLIVGS
ncbi:MAG: EVE domain-containing protein [Planctomycetota bacterium]